MVGMDETNQDIENTEALRAVQRILSSATLRQSEGLRHLLRYLFDKTLSGEADDLKEYTIGVECLGKTTHYDPRHESAVRIQLHRLRQKLVEYYHTEGKQDAFVVEMPKGQFKLAFESRKPAVGEAEKPEVRELPPASPPEYRYKRVLGVSLAAALAWGAYTTAELANLQHQTALFRAAWPPEVESLWRPFLLDRPLIVALQDPPFAHIPQVGYYSDQRSTTWDELMRSPATLELQKKYGTDALQPYFFFTGTAEASAAFTLGKLIGLRVSHISVARSSELSWQQFAENNVVLIGEARFFKERLAGLPAELEFVQNEGEIEILHPQSRDPAIPALGHGNVRGTGQQYALVSTLPGPAGKGIVRAFTSVGTSARLAALQAFIDPVQARALARKLADSSGAIPQYYQVVLKISYKDGVPTNIEYVFHRELHLKVPAGQPRTASH